MKVSDSTWHHRLSGLAKEQAERDAYWMIPFTNYKTFCPYLVGTYDRVGAELAHYFEKGASTMILDVPIGTEELEHVLRAIQRGANLAGHA
jgi:alkanesulfonate monooxygenase